MVISAVPNTRATMEKNIWLDNFFNVPYSNRIFISEDEDKIDIIEFYLKNIVGLDPKDNSILIDDKKDWLLRGKDIGMEVYHPTKIIASFQNRMLELQKQNQKKEENKDEPAIQQNPEEVSDEIPTDSSEIVEENNKV